MADESTAASTNRRSLRERQSQGQKAKTPKKLSKPKDRPRAKPGRPGFWKRLRNQLAEEWKLLIDSLIEASLGLSEIPFLPPSPPPSPGVGQATGSPEPGIQEAARQLMALQPEAFEDAILQLVRTNEVLKHAYDKAPQDIPDIAHHANNAYWRELQREANTAAARQHWERGPHPTASPQPVPTEPVPPGQSLLGPEGLRAIRNSQDSQPNQGDSPSATSRSPLASNNPYRTPDSAPSTTHTTPNPRSR